MWPHGGNVLSDRRRRLGGGRAYVGWFEVVDAGAADLESGGGWFSAGADPLGHEVADVAVD